MLSLRGVRRLLAPLLLPLVACGGALIPKTYVAPAMRTVDDEVAEVENVRHAVLGTPVPVRVLDDESFEIAIRASRAKTNAENVERAKAFSSAFTFASPGTDLRERYQHEQNHALGFYSATDRAMVVRKRESARDELLTLAHETAHALQHERHLLPKLAPSGDDAFLAMQAVVEGDAELTAALTTASDNAESPEYALARASRAEDTLHVVKSERTTPTIIVTWLSWPYLRGTAFVSDLYRAGGWPQVDAALRAPPTTTEQVIHLDKYLSGEQAIPIKTPAVPAGFRSTAKGTLGELTTGELLAECMDETAARDAAAGWGGDAYLVVTDEETTGLLWMTAWDDERSAIRFEHALTRRRVCAHRETKPPFEVVRSGRSVAFVQGMEDAADLAKGMFPLVGQRLEPRPPSPGTRAPARAALPRDFVGRGAMQGGHWIDTDIGFEADLTGLHIEEGGEDINLTASAPGIRVIAAIRWGAMSPQIEEHVTAQIVASMRKGAGRAESHLWDEGRESVKLAWTNGEARHLTFADDMEIRVVFAPGCGGKLTYMFAVASRSWGPAAWTSERWLASLRAPGADTSPACEAVRALGAMP